MIWLLHVIINHLIAYKIEAHEQYCTYRILICNIACNDQSLIQIISSNHSIVTHVIMSYCWLR